MCQLLVFGYGNPLREDDGIGPAITEQLRDTLRNPSIQYEIAHQPLPEHAELFASSSSLLLIDCQEGPDIGGITIRSVDRDAPKSATPHQVGLDAILAMSRTLYDHQPATTLLTIESNRLGYSDRLSSVMWENFKPILLRTEQHIRQILSL